MKKFNFIQPEVKRVDTEVAEEQFKDSYGEFEIKPLERGYALTLGNALRRVLISSMPGVAIVGVKIDGVNNEFMALEGIVEDVTKIVLNLKSIILKIEPEKLYDALKDEQDNLDQLYKLHFEGMVKAGKVFTAGDLEIADSDVTIVNPDQPIATFTADRRFAIQCFARRGVGYVSASENKMFTKDAAEQRDVEILPIDAIYSPVKRVNYDVESARVDGDVSYESLKMQIWTNCSVKPVDILSLASQFLSQHFNAIASQANEHISSSNYMPVQEVQKDTNNELLDMSIDELNIPARASNALHQHNIETLGELVKKSENQMMKIKNLGRKTFKEIEKALAEKGLSFAKEKPTDDFSDDLDEPLDDEYKQSSMILEDEDNE